MKKYLLYVNDIAIRNVDEGGDPFGAIVVCDGEIIGEGVNEMHMKPDVSLHAEMNAIREAQQHLKTTDLSGCTLYASGHPCPMCLGAIGFSNIKDVVYFNSLEDAEKVGLGLSKDIYAYIKEDDNKISLSMKQEKIVSNDPMLYYATKSLAQED
ncbi:MAG TPA: nucleoside deaminase [Erysipelothrix sp.]|nr:nucleoside deaminase [Erysipelothrix sp.]